MIASVKTESGLVGSWKTQIIVMKEKEKVVAAKTARLCRAGNVKLFKNVKMVQDPNSTNARENNHNPPVRTESELDGNWKIQTIVTKAKEAHPDVETVKLLKVGNAK